MAYTIRMLFLNQGEAPPEKAMDGTFASLREAWDAASAEVLAYQLRSIETAFQVLDGDGRIVEVTAEQVHG